MKCVIRTFSGKNVNPLDLRFEDICIEDIAHGLALCNRFAGQSRKPISVAQHSVYVSRLCDSTGFELQGLLHDASEAYLGDVTKWLKAMPEMAAYREAEDRAQVTIYKAFNCSWAGAYDVDVADRLMVRYEGSRGFKNFCIDHPDYPPLTPEEVASVGAWAPWSWRAAEEAFLTRFRLLTASRRNAGPRGEAPASLAP